MATISKPFTFSAGATIVASEHNSNFDTIYNEFNGNIANANISGSAAIADTKLAQITTASKVSTTALTTSTSFTSTGDWGFNSVQFAETTAPSTAAGEGALYTKDTGGQPELFYREESDGDEIQITSGGNVSAAGKVAQVVNTQDGAVATGSTAMPDDDTIPQNTEGDEYMTRSITPTNASSNLKIDVTFVGSVAGDEQIAVALFQDTTADALAAVTDRIGVAANTDVVTFSHFMTAGTTSPTTFKVRAGNNGGNTVTFNGESGARRMGGVMASSITITEFTP